MKIEEKEEDIAKDENEDKKEIKVDEDKKSSKSEDKKNLRVECIQKKRKRFTKYKKAIYKYRLEKKKYLYNSIFNPKVEPNKKTEIKKEVEIPKDSTEINPSPIQQRKFDDIDPQEEIDNSENFEKTKFILKYKRGKVRLCSSNFAP